MCAVLVLTTSPQVQTKSLRIGAAADLQPVLPPLIANFERATGTTVEVSYASSATLTTQILNGAPYDLFLAANRAFPQRIVAAKLAAESQPVTYARGALVLWVRHGVLRVLNDPLTMQSLEDKSVHRIAIANPEHAPYGAAAVSALHAAGLTTAVQSKLVFAENIAQAAQFGQSGNAECALISKTIAITPIMQQAGRYVVVPVNSYPPIDQGAVVLRNAAHAQAARKFLEYLQSPAGRKLLAASGLDVPAP